MPREPQCCTSKLISGADTDQLSLLHTPQRIEDGGDEGTELLQAIGTRDDHNDGNAGRGHILLERKVLIDGQEPLKALCEHQS